jgi:serine/threonine protein phosphatase PrpC
MLSDPLYTKQQDRNDFFTFNITTGIFTKAAKAIDHPVKKPIADDQKYENEEINCLCSSSYGLGSAEMQGSMRTQQQDGLIFGLTDIENIEEVVNHTITSKKFNPYGGATVACAAISGNGNILTTQHLGDARVAVIVRIKNPTTGDIQYISEIVTEDHDLNLERIRQNFIPQRNRESSKPFTPGIGYKKPGETLEIIARTNTLRIYKAEVVDHEISGEIRRGVVLIDGGTNCGGVVGDNFVEPEEDKILRIPDVRRINLQEHAEELIVQSGFSTTDYVVDQIEVVVACDGLFDLPIKDSMGVDFKTKSSYDSEGKIEFDSVPFKSKSAFHLSALKKQFDEESNVVAARIASGDSSKMPETFANFLRRKLADHDRASTQKILYDNLSIISCDTSKLKTCDDTVFMAVCDGHSNGNAFEGYGDGADVANDLAARLCKATDLRLPEDLRIEQGRGVFSAHIGPHLRAKGVRNSMTAFDDIYRNMLTLYKTPAINTAPNLHRYQFSFTDAGTCTTITLGDPTCIRVGEEDKIQRLSVNIVDSDGKITEFSNANFFDFGDDRMSILNSVAEDLRAKKTEIFKALREGTTTRSAASGPNPFAREAASAGTTGIFRRIEERAELRLLTTSPADDVDWEGSLGMADSFGTGIGSLASDRPSLGESMESYEEEEVMEKVNPISTPEPQSGTDLSDKSFKSPA